MCVQEENRLKREGLQLVHIVSQGHNGKGPKIIGYGIKSPNEGKHEETYAKY